MDSDDYNGRERRFSASEVNDIINTNTLVARMERLDAKYSSVLDKFEGHMQAEEKDVQQLRQKMDDLAKTIGSSQKEMVQCKTDIEAKVQTKYVTHDQLKISLLEVTNAITTRITQSDVTLKELIQQNRDDIRQFRNYFAAAATIISIIIGGINFYKSHIEQQQIEMTEKTRNEARYYMEQIRKDHENMQKNKTNP